MTRTRRSDRRVGAFERFVVALVVAAVVGCVVGACSNLGPGWVAATSTDAEPTSDGLMPIAFSGFARGWIRSGERFADFSTLMIAPPTVRYLKKPTDEVDSLRLAGEFPNEPNFALTDGEMAAFGRYIVESFRQELGRSVAFELVAEPKSDTLVVVPSIVDLVMSAPLGALPGGEIVLTTSPATMTLVLELVDARSGEVLARFAERRSAVRPGSDGVASAYSSDPTQNAAALRYTFRSWARTLRYRLDGTRVGASSAGSAAPDAGDTPRASPVRGSSPS